MLVGAQVVDPELGGPRRLARGLTLEEEHVCLDALGVEDACVLCLARCSGVANALRKYRARLIPLLAES